MEVKVCRSCKKMFQYIAGAEVCPQCREVEEEMFQKVKVYLKEHPGANIYEINQETGVSAKLLEKFLKQGRLEVSADSVLMLSCERCGRKITTGRFCNGCQNEVANQLHEVKRMLMTPDKKEDTGPRMRYLGSDRIK